jgi:hypothetical protein
MSANILDQQPNQRLFTKVNDLERQLSELRTLQQQGRNAVNLQNSGDYTASWTAAVNTYYVITFHFQNLDNKQLFGTFEFTPYQDTTANSAKALWRGDVSLDSNWKIFWYRDKEASDGNDLWDYVYVSHSAASPLPITLVGRWRFIVSSGTGST